MIGRHSGLFGGQRLYHGAFNQKNHNNLKNFGGVDPPEIPAKLKTKCRSWIEVIAEVDILIDEHKERLEQLKRMRKAFEKARHQGVDYPT
jgi:hypothetical protein